MNEDVLKKVFDLLLENKEFPNYHAERRIDIFINYFVARILTAYLITPSKFICPEFPLKKEKNNQSTKLDYLCKAGAEIIFVELKTDKESFSEAQAEIYLNCDWNTCLINLGLIIGAVKRDSHKLSYKVLDGAISAIKSEPVSRIRVIYISPIIDSKRFKNTRAENIQPLAELDISMAENETVIWDFIKKLELSIFEIVR